MTHGSRSTYHAGCRCPDCTAANTAASCARRERLRSGLTGPATTPAPPQFERPPVRPQPLTGWAARAAQAQAVADRVHGKGKRARQVRALAEIEARGVELANTAAGLRSDMEAPAAPRAPARLRPWEGGSVGSVGFGSAVVAALLGHRPYRPAPVRAPATPPPRTVGSGRPSVTPSIAALDAYQTKVRRRIAGQGPPP